MPHNERIPEQPNPYEELVLSLSHRVDRPSTKALLKYLRILDMKAQVAFDRTIRNEKVISSIDDCVASMSEESEELKDKLRKDFYNKPTKTNSVERSQPYQQAQGFTESSRLPDMDEDRDMWDCEVVFDDPYEQAAFDDAVDILQTINPEISIYKLYKILENS
jgi:hypothetical protein